MRTLAERVCPWCNVRIVVDLDAVDAVCDSCGARYATALTRRREIAVTVASHRNRAGRWIALRAGTYVAIGVVLPFAAVVGVMVIAVVAFWFVVGWVLSKTVSPDVPRRVSRGDLPWYDQIFGSFDDPGE